MVKDTLEARRRRWHAVMAKEPEQKRLKEIEARECALQRKEALEVNLLKQKELQIAARKAAREATLRRREALKLQASAVMAKERELREYDNTHTHTPARRKEPLEVEILLRERQQKEQMAESARKVAAALRRRGNGN